MCFEGRCLFCSVELGTMICVAIDTALSTVGIIIPINIFVEGCGNADTFFLISIFSLFIGCIVNILFNIYLIEGIFIEEPMRLIVYLAFSVFKNLGMIPAVIMILHFKYSEDILIATSCFFFEIAVVLCVYDTHKKLIQKKKGLLKPLMPENA